MTSGLTKGSARGPQLCAGVAVLALGVLLNLDPTGRVALVSQGFEVALPYEIAMSAHREYGDQTKVPMVDASAGALADIAAYAATFGSSAAVIVTLLQTPSTMRSLATEFADRRKPRGEAYWLRVRGPGGQANIELTEPLDEDVITGLMRAVWQLPDQD